MSAFLISKLSDPFANLAIGSYTGQLLRTKKIDYSRIMFLSSSHHGVFIGRNQNCWTEANIPLMEKNGVPLVRRDTGGGACYVDRGNRLFGFISRDHNKIAYPVVLSAMQKLNLPAKLQGRNDIVIDGYKISGSAFSADGDVSRHHGTILVDVNKDNLLKYLTPNKLKLQSKGVASAVARIHNLVDFDKDITVDKVDSAMVDSFNPDKELQLDELLSIDRKLYDKIYSTLTSKEHIFNNNPEFTHRFEHKFSFGLVEFYLRCEKNRIVGCDIFSDSLDVKLVENLKMAFLGHEYDILLPMTVKNSMLKSVVPIDQNYKVVVNELYDFLNSMHC